MSVAWPSTLPLPQFGLRYNVADPQMRTLMASGRTISRRRFSDVPTEFPARWILRQSEAEIFEQFYQNDAVDGSEWIEMPLVSPRGEGVFFVRFRGVYRYRRVGADLWEYSANLQMYSRIENYYSDTEGGTGGGGGEGGGGESIPPPWPAPQPPPLPPEVPADAVDFTRSDLWTLTNVVGTDLVVHGGWTGNPETSGWRGVAQDPYTGNTAFHLTAGSWADSFTADSVWIYLCFYTQTAPPPNVGLESSLVKGSVIIPNVLDGPNPGGLRTLTINGGPIDGNTNGYTMRINLQMPFMAGGWRSGEFAVISYIGFVNPSFLP